MRKQWSLLIRSNVQLPANIKANEFWFELSQVKDAEGNCFFADLARVALISLCVPHSNVDPERLFSDLNFIKSKVKNALLTETLEAVLRVRQMFKSLRSLGEDFEPTQLMIDLYLGRVYNEKKVTQSRSLLLQ